MIKEIERRIFVDEDILVNEYDYCWGVKCEKPVLFTYHNMKTNKDVVLERQNYSRALDLARSRERDGRYKNFEFFIEPCLESV